MLGGIIGGADLEHGDDGELLARRSASSGRR